MIGAGTTQPSDLPMPPAEAGGVLLLGGVVALLVILDQYRRTRS